MAVWPGSVDGGTDVRARGTPTLPPHAITLALGLAVLGLTSYVFLTVAARQLSPGDFGSVSVLWSIVYIVGPGLFQPFEQQIGRSLSALRARGDTSMGQLRHAVRLAVVVLAALLALTAAAALPITRILFDGSYSVVAALLLSVVAMAAAYVYRGVMAGQGRFDLYGLQLGAEGTFRFLGCLVLLVLAGGSVGPFAMLIPVALLVSVLVVARPRLLRPSSPATVTSSTRDHGAVADAADTDELGMTLLWLVVGAVLSQMLVNAATVLVKVLERADPATAGHLLAGLMVARLPLFMFAAVQAVLLPGLSALVAQGLAAALRRRVGLLCLGVGVVMTVAVVVIGAVGSWAVRLLFGPSFDLSGGLLAALTAGTALYMVAVVLANAGLAIGRFPAVAACWGIGVAAMLGVTAMPGTVVTRVVAGFIVGAGVSCAALALVFRTSARSLDTLPVRTLLAHHDATGGRT